MRERRYFGWLKVNVTGLLLALVVIYSTSVTHVITCTNKTLLCFCFDNMKKMETFYFLDS